MAGEGTPALVWTFDVLIIWITATCWPDMYTDRQPPLSHFATLFDGVPTDVAQFNWIDNHSFQLDYQIPPTGPPDVITLGYSPFDPGLFTIFAQLYNAWDPVVVPKL